MEVHIRISLVQSDGFSDNHYNLKKGQGVLQNSQGFKRMGPMYESGVNLHCGGASEWPSHVLPEDSSFICLQQTCVVKFWV